MHAMEERKACALLKERFEAAGLAIEENRAFDEGGVRFEIDGYDPEKRVGYEYLTEEAGDSWDVDGDVKAALAARRAKGELYVLVIDEAEAPDADALGEMVDEFLGELKAKGVIGGGAEKKKKPAPPKKKPAPAKGARKR